MPGEGGRRAWEVEGRVFGGVWSETMGLWCSSCWWETKGSLDDMI